MKEQFNDDWRRSKELSITTAKGIRSLIDWLKRRWVHWIHRKIAEDALERYYRTEYKNFNEGVRRDRIERDLVRMSSYY